MEFCGALSNRNVGAGRMNSLKLGSKYSAASVAFLVVLVVVAVRGEVASRDWNLPRTDVQNLRREAEERNAVRNLIEHFQNWLQRIRFPPSNGAASPREISRRAFASDALDERASPASYRGVAETGVDDSAADLLRRLHRETRFPSEKRGPMRGFHGLRGKRDPHLLLDSTDPDQ